MIEKTGNDLVVIAAQPLELVEGQNALIERMKEKEYDAQGDIDAAISLIAHCDNASISATAAKRLKVRAESRLLFLGKVREALEAGYVIVPNFRGDTIAVRVKREKPQPQTQTSTYRTPRVPDQTADILPVGEGRYVNPDQLIRTIEYTDKDALGKEVTHYQVSATAFQDEIGLPVEFLKPTVVEMIGKCMARKIFDEVALTGRNENNGDPMVFGRIIDRKNNRRLTFLVAWFIDTKEI